MNTSYAYVMDQGVAGHYEFHDASSASRQVIRDDWKNINFTIEYHKEIELVQDPKPRYISRWTAKIKVQRPTQFYPSKGRPVFFIAKEGNLTNEDGYFKVFNKDDSTFYKVMHGVGNLTYE